MSIDPIDQYYSTFTESLSAMRLKSEEFSIAAATGNGAAARQQAYLDSAFQALCLFQAC